MTLIAQSIDIPPSLPTTMSATIPRTLTDTQMAYENIYEWTATLHFRKDIITVEGRLTATGELTSRFTVKANKLEMAVEAGVLMHNTPAYIACRNVVRESQIILGNMGW